MPANYGYAAVYYCPPLALDTMSQAGHIAQIRSDPSLWRRRAGPACEPAREASWFSCNNPASNLAPAHIPRAATLPRLHTVPVVVPPSPRRAPVHHHISPRTPPKKRAMQPRRCASWPTPVDWPAHGYAFRARLLDPVLLILHQRRRLVMVHCPEVAEPYAEGQ